MTTKSSLKASFSGAPSVPFIASLCGDLGIRQKAQALPKGKPFTFTEVNMAKLTRFRIKKDRNYTTIHNQIFRNPDISLRARGFFATVMTLPDTWDFSVNGMASILKESKHVIYKAIAELEAAGYIKRIEVRDKGKFKEMLYEFNEVIAGLEPYPTFSDTVLSDTINRPQLSKQEIKYSIDKEEEDSVVPFPTETSQRADADVIFIDGLAYLTASGIPERQARSLLAKLRKLKGDAETANVVHHLISHRILRPDEYIGAIFKNTRQAPPKGPNGLPIGYKTSRELIAEAYADALTWKRQPERAGGEG